MDAVEDQSWRARAACLGSPPELFFPERSEEWEADAEAFAALDPPIILDRPPRDDVMAKSICGTCAVAENCLDLSVRTAEKFGIWAAGDQHRRSLRRQWGRSMATGNWGRYYQAIAGVVEKVKGNEVRPRTPRRDCARCARSGISNGFIPAGHHPVDENGENARCGFPVTYARGCRCWHCALARAQRTSDLFIQRVEENRAATIAAEPEEKPCLNPSPPTRSASMLTAAI